MTKRTAVIALLVLTASAAAVFELTVRTERMPPTEPPSAPPVAAVSPLKQAPIVVVAPAPAVPAAPQSAPAQPRVPDEGTTDAPGDPLAQAENPSEQFMHSRRGDGQHSE